MEKNITGEKMLSHIDRIAGEKKPINSRYIPHKLLQ